MRYDLEKDNGHLLVPVLRKSGAVSVKTVHKEYGTELLKGCWLEFAESGCPIFRATTPLPRGRLKSIGGEKLSIHYCADPERRLKLFFAQLFLQISSVFTEQSQKCVKSTKPFTIDRSTPLWEGNRVPHSC